ncbi:MAG: AIR synthase-related protein, partial [Nitrososphaerales archaeon]
NLIKSYGGVKRKLIIGELARLISEECKYEDAGWFPVNGKYVLISSDGIAEDLVSIDPELSGFYCVLVNVNDVVAKGGKPIALSGVVSSSSPEIRRQITLGIKRALKSYGLILAKMHTHPDSLTHEVSGTVVGITENPIPSSTAQNGDKLVVAVDVKGKFGDKKWIRTFDTVSTLNKDEISKRIEPMILFSKLKLVNAAKDISMPGVIGTVAMLCESSRKGAVIDVERIPKPSGVDLATWLLAYPSFGFIVTTDDKRVAEVLNIFRERGYFAEIVGGILSTTEVSIIYNGEKRTVFDIEKDRIFG